MNTSKNKFYSSQKANVYTVFMAALAVIILFVSCPLKRVLQNDFAAGSSTPVRTNQTNINQPTTSDFYASNEVCGVNQKAELTKFKTSQKVIPAFTNLSHISLQSGFDINYLLSRIKDEPAYSVSSKTTSLPLYLQHLRLLI